MLYTIKLEDTLVNKLHAFRRKRSNVTYDIVGSVSDTEVSELIKIAKRLKNEIQNWLLEQYPHLLEPK
jgi:hypothetical protein